MLALCGRHVAPSARARSPDSGWRCGMMNLIALMDGENTVARLLVLIAVAAISSVVVVLLGGDK